jgi:hypothetical protein
VLKRYPDVLSGFFLAFDAKMSSPAILNINRSIYTNISSLVGGFKEVRVDALQFASDFMPWQNGLFRSTKAKPDLFITSRMTPKEIGEFIDSIDSDISKNGNFAFFNADYFDPITKIALAGLLLTFLFQEQILCLRALTNLTNMELLEYIYKTRENSFFSNGLTVEMPEDFDPLTESNAVEINPINSSPLEFDLLYKLSRLKKLLSKEKIARVLILIYSTLDLRDKLLMSAVKFHKAVRGAMLNHAEYVKGRKKINRTDDLFLFDIEDIRRLVNDTYYSSLTPTIEYKRSYYFRSAAQIMPYEIYEADIKFSGLIAEETFFKRAEQKSFALKSIFPKDITGKADGNLDSEIVCRRAFSLSAISKLNSPQALITEVVPPLSYLNEYCFLKGVPLYYGIRNVEELLKGHTVRLTAGKIYLESDDE